MFNYVRDWPPDTADDCTFRQMQSSDFDFRALEGNVSLGRCSMADAHVPVVHAYATVPAGMKVCRQFPQTFSD